MTPAQRKLRKTLRAYLTSYDRTDTPYVNEAGFKHIWGEVCAVIAEERERCAKVAEPVDDVLAKVIREGK